MSYPAMLGLLMVGAGLLLSASSATQSPICRPGGNIFDPTFSLTEDVLQSTVSRYALDTAINRAIFYSLMYKWTAYEAGIGWRNPSYQVVEDHRHQPGVNYIYMSTAVNVHAGPSGVVTSGLFFDRNSAYPNWLTDVPFNATVKLLGIRADQHNVKDLGSSPQTNYTDRSVYPQYEFLDHMRSSNRNQMQQTFLLNHHQPGHPTEQVYFPVNLIDRVVLGRFTQAFYDCGQTEQWLLQAESMVTELMARSSFYMHLRHLKSVATSTVGVSVEALASGNAGATARAPLSPSRHEEGRAELLSHDATNCPSLEEPNAPIPLAASFWSLEDLAVTLEVEGRAGLRLAHFLSNFLQNNDFRDNAAHAQTISDRWRTWRFGDDPIVFEDPMIEVMIDQPLTSKQLISEAYATLMSEESILGVGIYFDAGVFPESSDPVSAFAWKETDMSQSQSSGVVVGHVIDVFRQGQDFTAEDWFVQAKQAYTTLTDDNSGSFSNGREVRTRRDGLPRPTPEPVTYIAAEYGQGTWLPPHFLCGPRLAGWAASYVTPIFTRGTNGPVFGGVVKVDASFTASNVSP